MKVTIYIWFAMLINLHAEEAIIADTEHNQIEQMAANENKLHNDIAVEISETDELLIDFSRLTADKVKELAKSNVIHITVLGSPRKDVFWATWDPAVTRMKLSAKNLKSEKPDAKFSGFKAGTYGIAAGKKTPQNFTIPWAILLKVKNQQNPTEQAAPSDGENPYIAGGIPASDREWIGRDYVAIFEVIEAGKAPLPMLEDPFGKRVIQRLTNEENFSFHKNKSLPIGQRLGDYVQLQQSFNSIFKIYILEMNKGKKVHAETAVLSAFSLRIAALGIVIVNEFIPTIPKDNGYEYRMQAIKEMYGGVTFSFAGAVASLTETKYYSSDDLALIIKAMHSTLPTMKQAFTQEYKLELVKNLSAHREHFQGNDLSALEGMIKILQSEQGGADQPSIAPETKPEAKENPQPELKPDPR